MSGPAEMLPARLPDGWWFGHARYRRYVLFAATGGVLWAGALIVVGGIVALGRGCTPGRPTWRGSGVASACC